MFVILKSKTNYYAVHMEGSKEATELVELGYWKVAQAETEEAAIEIIKALTNPLLRGSAAGMISFEKVRSSHGTFYETIYTGSVEEWKPAIDNTTTTLPVALIPIEQMDAIAATLRSRGEWVYIDPTDRWRP